MGQPIQLLFDIEVTAGIFSLTVDVVDRLCQLGELTPSVVIGARTISIDHSKNGDVRHVKTGQVTPPSFPFTHSDLAPPTA